MQEKQFIDKGVDIELEPEEVEEEPFVRYEITTYPSDYTLEVLHRRWQDAEIIIPEFQRRYVWDQDRASLLIDSFLYGLPVPPVFFYVDENNRSVVIDGQQRLKSIFYFFEGYFGEPDSKGKRKVFKLTGLSERNRFCDLTYKDFKDTDDGVKLRNAVMRAVNILQLSPPGKTTAMFHIFERLNKGAVPLTPQEIRNCIYRGSFNDLLHKLNEYYSWRTIIGKDQPDSRMKDIELILRVTALATECDKYESPMKEFLNKFMAKNQNQSTEWLDDIETRFTHTADTIVDMIGKRPFRPRRAINTSVLDSVFALLMQSYPRYPENIAERYQSLLSSDVFVSYGTNSTKAITSRFREVRSRLLE